MHIAYLADHPALIPTLAELHFKQWGYLHPGETLAERTRRLEACCGRGGIPSAVVALEGEELVGSAMLVAHDMDTRQDLTPWLAGLYVVASHRGLGHGAALVRRVEWETTTLGIRTLYLYTPDAMDFYSMLGWAAVEGCQYLGQDVTVMSKRLPQAPGAGIP